MDDAVPAGGWTDAEATGAGASSRPDGAGDAQGSQCDGRRLRFFDHAMRKACWEKADVVPGRHPDRPLPLPLPLPTAPHIPPALASLLFLPRLVSSFLLLSPLAPHPALPSQDLSLPRATGTDLGGGVTLNSPQKSPPLSLPRATGMVRGGRWRVDAAGNTVGRRFNACMGCLCYEFDHIVPYSKGGPTSVENCQVLQTRVNRFKIKRHESPLCLHRARAVEIRVAPQTDTGWGGIPGGQQAGARGSSVGKGETMRRPSASTMHVLLRYASPHRLPQNGGSRGWPPSPFPSPVSSRSHCTDKDLDLVEMAVYGDVVRPGMQCRVTTVAEAMGVLPPAPRRRPTKPQQQYGACHWPGAASEQGSLS
ncbi:unnamed protein product [Closterium sp. NIES-53]